MTHNLYYVTFENVDQQVINRVPGIFQEMNINLHLRQGNGWYFWASQRYNEVYSPFAGISQGLTTVIPVDSQSLQGATGITSQLQAFLTRRPQAA